MKPVLYSFRRCPYAMRARIAIKYSGQKVNLREVVLREMPTTLLESSPKGTVPVLILPNGDVIDESLDIMYWAVAKHDPDSWILPGHNSEVLQLITTNDNEFKHYLDRYKYADRFPEQQPEYYREKCLLFLQELEQRLSVTSFLMGNRLSIADTAIFPFIRQFAFVNKEWFDNTEYRFLQNWLSYLLDSEYFKSVMQKYTQWHVGDTEIVF